MSKQSIPKSRLRDKLKEREVSLGYVEKTRKMREGTLNHLLRFMDERSLVEYNLETGKCFFNEVLTSKDASKYKKNSSLRLVSILDSICTNSPTPMHRKTATYPLYGTMASLASDYLDYLKNVKRLSERTIKTYRYCLSYFTQKMSMLEVDWESLKFSHIVDFLSSRKNAATLVYTDIRGFLNFAYTKGGTKEDFSLLLKSARPHRKEPLPSCYTPEEVMRVESAVDRRSSKNKRDYAIILLATRLGLRSSDIRLLEFKNLDWDRNEINIVQYKTGRELSLPLLAEVGEAIIDYIKNGRPASKLKTIFLTCTHPHKVCGAEAISNIVKHYFVLSGVDHKGKHTGPHALRHSFATAMLGADTTLPVISGVLGHESAESTMYYLGVDVKSLLGCSLRVPPVDNEFYTQKGGMLYV